MSSGNYQTTEANNSQTYCPTCEQQTQLGHNKCQGCGSSRPVEGWPRDPLIGAKFADTYLVIARLGSGGFGTVYLAENAEFSAKRAIKVLDCRHIHDDSILNRFKREAKALYQLQSPYTVRIERWGRTDDGQYYLVMEVAEGETLRELLDRKKTLKEYRALEITRQTAVALADAHALHIVHRDLKPENIVIRAHPHEGDRVAVLDFGISKILSDKSTNRRSGLVGTPAYMAPEIWNPDLGVEDIRADLWSLGLLLFEMLSGTSPFRKGTSGDFFGTALQAATLEPDAIARQLTSETVQPKTIEIIARLLRPNPDDRYANPSELIRQIETHPTWAKAKRTQRNSESRPKAPATDRTARSRDPEVDSQSPTWEDVPFTGSRPSEEFSFTDEPPESLRLERTGRRAQKSEEIRKSPSLKILVVACVILGLFWGGSQLLEIYSGLESNTEGSTDDTDQSDSGQGEIIADLPETRTGHDQMVLLLVPGGSWTMGDPDQASGNEAHNVTTAPFYLDETEITVEMWNRCEQTGRCTDEHITPNQEVRECRFRGATAGTSSINCVTWEGARAYCSSVGRRLPTEAEWERAARGPEQTLEPAASDDVSAFGPVGMGWGLREWTADWYSETYFSVSPFNDPEGPMFGTERVVRGGPAWDGQPITWVERATFPPLESSALLGFRCAQDGR